MGCAGPLDQPPASPNARPRSPRHAAGSRQPGPLTLLPSLLRPPSPSPSLLEPGLGHLERGSSRRRRDVVRRQGNRGSVRPAGGPRSEFADSRWGSARCHRPASRQCSGPTAAASTRRTAARPWPLSHLVPRKRELPRPRPPAVEASGRTRGLRDPGTCQHKVGAGPSGLLKPEAPSSGSVLFPTIDFCQCASAVPVPCGILLPPCGSSGKFSS